MKTLPDVLRRNGFDYVRVREGQRSYVYKQKDKERVVGFEVFLKQVKPHRQFNGITLPEIEKFPHNEAFGKWAWSCYNIKKAIRKFNVLEGISERSKLYSRGTNEK